MGGIAEEVQTSPRKTEEKGVGENDSGGAVLQRKFKPPRRKLTYRRLCCTI